MNSPGSLIGKSFKLFGIIFFLTGSIISGLLTLFYQKETLNYVDTITDQENYTLSMQMEQVNHALTRVFTDLFFIRDQNELHRFLETGNNNDLMPLNQEYVNLAAHSGLYDQIRYLDDTGMEIARVNFNRGNPVIVAPTQLQSKAGRYYFNQCFELSNGDVYISPFDLNIEKGKVEIPHKPMIRLCTPVLDDFGNKRGVVLLNYLGINLIDTILASERLAPGKTFMINRDGYWLIHPDPSKEWGFMFEERETTSFARAFPSAWETITSKENGRLHNKDGLFTFGKVFPLKETLPSLIARPGDKLSDSDDADALSGNYYWYLVSMIPEHEIETHSNVLLMQLFLLGAGIFLLAAIGSWTIAYTVTKRKLLQNQLKAMAYFDPLTNLPNRRHFFDRLEEALSFAIRYNKKTALLYIDLDGFKEINDSLGHDAGDAVLQHVADCLKQICRKSDTVARLGGDEFAIIIPRYEARQDIETVAAKIIAVLSRSYIINRQDAKIGASIGIAFAPEDTISKEDLIKKADSAMYYAKGQGKNQFLFYSDTVPEEAIHT